MAKLTYTTTSDSGFSRGLTVHLQADGQPVGKFSVVIDDEGFANNAEVAPNFQRQGYGTILLLLAMFEASRHELGFEVDHRGVTGAQAAVYNSAVAKGFIDAPVMGATSLTSEGEEYLESLDLI